MQVLMHVSSQNWHVMFQSIIGEIKVNPAILTVFLRQPFRGHIHQQGAQQRGRLPLDILQHLLGVRLGR
jgi:hypothetical protein